MEMPSKPAITVVGGGLAGCEAAWAAARLGVRVVLYEMRPHKMTPAHETAELAELVCSNSLKSASLDNASGILKEEMRRLGSVVIEAARRTSVPAGKALAVDRRKFAAYLTRTVEEHPLIEIVRREVTAVPDSSCRPAVVATGPLTSEPLAEDIMHITGSRYLYFYDSISPIVSADSIDFSKVFRASRYGRGETEEGDYLNCPLTEEEYRRFVAALLEGEQVSLKEFEKDAYYFEGCLPIEVMAARGPDTLRYGPMKPVGLIDPRTGKTPYAAVQLRAENREGTMYNLVGFQTKLKYGEQRRIFRMIPGLERAEFLRYGSIHRNTYIHSPSLLAPTLELKSRPRLYFAGQIVGVEGYVESAAMGIVAGLNAARTALGMDPLRFPPETSIGALIAYITAAASREFQPMNINFGLYPPPPRRMKKDEKRAYIAKRALAMIEEIAATLTAQ